MEKIERFNIIIAEFEGAVLEPAYLPYMCRFPDTWIYPGAEYVRDDLKYHKDWNWFMSAWKKLRVDDGKVDDLELWQRVVIVTFSIGYPDLERAFESLAYAIIRYNEINKKTS